MSQHLFIYLLAIGKACSVILLLFSNLEGLFQKFLFMSFAHFSVTLSMQGFMSFRGGRRPWLDGCAVSFRVWLHPPCLAVIAFNSSPCINPSRVTLRGLVKASVSASPASGFKSSPHNPEVLEGGGCSSAVLLDPEVSTELGTQEETRTTGEWVYV